MCRFGILVVVCALALAACASDGNDDTSSTPVPTSPAPTRTTNTTDASRATTTTVAPNLDAVNLSLEQVASGLDSPVALAWRADDPRLYVAEQGGTVRVVGTDGQPADPPVVTIAVSGANEQGLLGLDFSADGTKLYVDYTDPGGDSHIVEYTMNGDVVDESSRRELVFQKDKYPNHNGGQITIGTDGMLYFGWGDGGSGGDPDENGQDLSTLLGKILRINPQPSGDSPYSIPADNPFVNQEGARGEIWSYGLRNPWRWSFDRATGDMWIGDVGQRAYEEIDFGAGGGKGVNWQWNEREGLHPYKGGERPAGSQDPIIENNRSNGECAIVGGYVYRGTAIPNLNGVYLYSDFCAPAIIGAVQEGGRIVAARPVASLDSLTTFGEDKQGDLYAASREGTVYRFTAG
jgi:glucose/arabinose dehydrogenase